MPPCPAQNVSSLPRHPRPDSKALALSTWHVGFLFFIILSSHP